jgi:glyoxylase-like metal-dependent hydrolase (beta-lactamase superfamily II)
LVHAVRDRLLVLPDNTLVYPGHESPTTIGDEKKYNPYL